MLVSQQNNGSRFFNFALCQIFVKKLGRFQIVRVQTFLYTFYICLVLSKNRYGVFSRAVTCGFTGFKNKDRQILAVTKILGVFHMMHFGSFCRLTTEHNDSHP